MQHKLCLRMLRRKSERPAAAQAGSEAHDAMRCHSTTLRVLHTHRLKHTPTYTLTRTQTHTGLLLSAALQLTASLGVVFHRLDWQKLNKTLSLLRISLSLLPGEEASSCPGQSPPTPAAKRPPGTLRMFPPLPDSPRGFDSTAGARRPACSPVEPRCLSGAPLSSFREPCNKKSRLRRHTM